MLNQILRGGGGLIYDEHDNLTLSSNSLKVSPKNPFNDPNLYSIYKQESVLEWITYTCKKNVEEDFTISSWVYLTGAYEKSPFFMTNIHSSNDFYWTLDEDRFYKTRILFNLTELLLDHVPLNKWVYITCVRSNNQITVYYNGRKQGSKLLKYNSNLVLNKGGYLFSENYDGDSKCGIFGYIFDFFISDKAEWTGNFISPNRPFEYGNHVYLDNDKNIWGCSKL